MTIRELLRRQKNNLAAEEMDLLLALALHKNKAYLYKNSDKQLSRSQINTFKKLLRLHLAHWPLAYLQGQKEFYGLKFKVNKNVLTPRPETEILVDQALKFLKNKISQSVLEVGTGSGCIIISVAKNAPANNYLASDISTPALKIAKTNARKNGLKNKIKFIKSDLFSQIPSQKFTLIMANLPYLNSNQYKKPGLAGEELSIKKEPPHSLYGGNDGLKYYQNFFSQVKNFLAEEYQILIEIDPSQTEKIKEIVKDNLPSAKIEIIKDLAGLDRVVKINN